KTDDADRVSTSGGRDSPSSAVPHRFLVVQYPCPRIYYEAACRRDIRRPQAVLLYDGDATMARSKPSLLQRQLARVHQRLVFQSIVNSVIWCWVAGIVLAAAWLLVQPWVVAEPS